MDMLLGLAGLIVLAAVVQFTHLTKRLNILEEKLEVHQLLLRRALAGRRRTPPSEGEAKSAPTGMPEPEATEPGTTPPESATPAAEAGPDDARAARKGPWERGSPTSSPPQAGWDETRRPPREVRDVEQALASRWLVWLGGLAVALSAVFLFSYAVEQGWLGPLPRVGLGLFLGAALIAGGEWSHRRPIPGLRKTAGADYVPPALTASGVFALYASTYAAHALYGLISPGVAFAALAVVSAVGLVLALRQGWFVALLGLAGGYAMPALLHSESSAAIPVFVYLAALTAGCLALMRLRSWPFLAVATLVGSAGWPVLWMLGSWTPGDQGTLGIYTVAVAALCGLLSTGVPAALSRPATPAWLDGVVADSAGLGFIAHGLVLVLLAVVADYNAAAFMFLGLYAALGLAFGLRRAAYESLAVASAIVVGIAFFLWPQPAPLTVPEELARHGIENWGDTFGPITMPPEFLTFARAALGFAAVYGIGGFLALRRVATPAVWAGLSAAVPLYLLALAYWRIGGLGLDLSWGAMAATLSFAGLGAAVGVHRRLGRGLGDLPLGFYGAACTAALALAFTCVLREAWLTVALSAEVLALAWIWSRLQVDALRGIAWAVAGAVIVRLVLNPAVIDYQGGIAGLMSWVAYGYGLPAIAFLAAARLFGDARRDPLATLCEAGAAAFGILAVALQIRAWTAGTLFAGHYGLFDQAVQTNWWLVAAGLLLRREVTARSHVALYGGRALLALAGLQVVLGHVIANNPLDVAMGVGGLPLFNLLALAYLLPAALAWVFAADGRFDLPAEARRLLGIAAGVLAFSYVTLEVRRAFQGSVIALGPERMAENAEVYAYSAVWLVYALALLGLGILRGSSVLRYASLTVLIVTLAKVFLYDMADLTGLYRVASFLGLGLTLIGIGHVYRRFVFQPAAGPS